MVSERERSRGQVDWYEESGADEDDDEAVDSRVMVEREELPPSNGAVREDRHHVEWNHGHEDHVEVVPQDYLSKGAKEQENMAVIDQTKDLTSLLIAELIETLKAHEKRVILRNESMSKGTFNVRTREYGFKRDNTEGHVKQGGKWCELCKRSNHTENECWRKPKDGFKRNNIERHVKQGKKWCEFCKRSNHTENECWRKPKKTDQIKEKKECYNCGKIGHFVRKCHSKKYKRANKILEEEDSVEDPEKFRKKPKLN